MVVATLQEKVDVAFSPVVWAEQRALEQDMALTLCGPKSDMAAHLAVAVVVA